VVESRAAMQRIRVISSPYNEASNVERVVADPAAPDFDARSLSQSPQRHARARPDDLR
jgi:hypothetical protein